MCKPPDVSRPGSIHPLPSESARKTGARDTDRWLLVTAGSVVEDNYEDVLDIMRQLGAGRLPTIEQYLRQVIEDHVTPALIEGLGQPQELAIDAIILQWRRDRLLPYWLWDTLQCPWSVD